MGGTPSSIIDQKCPFKGQFSLTGYAQSSVPGELSDLKELQCGNHSMMIVVLSKLKSFKICSVDLS